MRQIYETAADLKNEREVAEMLTHAWCADLKKTPPKYPYDYIAIDGTEVVAFIEIKNRNNAADKYETYMISLDKIVQCQTASVISGVGFYLVVRFTDKVMFWSFSENQFHVESGGRFDRGDKQDVEPVVHIPMIYFKEV